MGENVMFSFARQTLGVRKSRVVLTVLRLLFGLWMAQAGLNYFFRVYPEPAFPPEASLYGTAITATHFLAIAKIIEMLGGLALLVNRFVPFALAILMTVSATILWLDVDVFGAHSWPVRVLGIFAFTTNAVLIGAYWKYFSAMFAYRA